jgi:CheY-like chemotaxis protein
LLRVMDRLDGLGVQAGPVCVCGAASSAESVLVRLSALIVDDFPPLAAAVAERLGLEGYESSLAGSVAEADGILRRGRTFDIAFVDISLPDGNGFELAARLRLALPHCFIVVASGFAISPRDPRLRGRVDGVLRKPWQGSDLRRLLARALKKRQARASQR